MFAVRSFGLMRPRLLSVAMEIAQYRYASASSVEALRSWAASNPSCSSAAMPPNDIYHCDHFYKAENRPNGMLRQFWTYVGHTQQFDSQEARGKYITATLGANLPIIITQNDKTGNLAGFVNLCRHRAAILLDKADKDKEGTGCGSFGPNIVCKYHGWQYAPDGRLARAVSMKGVENFTPKENGLVPVDITTMGPFIFARLQQPAAADEPRVGSLQECFPSLEESLGDLSSFIFVGRRTYPIKCNWKVFADNYLDGGYHISRLHPGLASQLDLRSYRTSLHPHHSLQVCDALPESKRKLMGSEVEGRVGPPIYAWLFPATAINKYGPWIDVHTVVPAGPAACAVTFDYFLHHDVFSKTDKPVLDAQLQASIDVQMEDIGICESVQAGLSSGGYSPGRYAAPETPSHHFHQLLAKYI